ncbi:MAG: hypothetical protein K0R57_366 [Paenibacillaceae bacterium]|jgi:hypothetical protein|nr:hypothetical protein [Paenibacillaceae bacterium]
MSHARTDYLAFAGLISDKFWSNYEQRLEESRKNAVQTGSCQPLGHLAHLAAVEAFRYRITGEALHGQRAKQAMQDIGSGRCCFQQQSPAGPGENGEAQPVLDSMFNLTEYLRAYELLENTGLLSPVDKAHMQMNITEALEPVFRMPDWGPHNRAVSRALNLETAASLFPQAEQAELWRSMAHNLMEDNWGRWSIEDSTIYTPIWLNGLFAYAERTGRKDLMELPMPRYYCEMFVRLLHPRGVVADYGDAGWGSGWARLVACLEKGAAYYRSAEMKYAARTIFDTMSPLEIRADGRSLRMASALLDAYSWADDRVAECVPDYGSGEALDDVIGKKVVFRNGWHRNSAFLLLNYRDEGDYARPARTYLRQTLRVNEEKAHHGHGDENSIVCLIAGNEVLLHDGGYRDSINDTSGAYRSDLYHNRVLVRPGRPEPGQCFLDFCRDDGRYRKVRTEKLHFSKFAPLEMSRTAVEDCSLGVSSHRTVIYLKQAGCYIIADMAQLLHNGSRTCGPVFYTGAAQELLPGGYRTSYDSIGSSEFPGQIINGGDMSLFVYFPLGEARTVGTGPIRRSHTTETGVYQYASGCKEGEILTFVTVLQPVHAKAEFTAAQFAREWSVKSGPGGHLSIAYESAGQRYLMGIKGDLEVGTADAALRPAYDYQHGAVNYGEICSDADFVYGCFGEAGGQFGFLNGTRVDVEGKTRFAVPASRFKQLDLSMAEGVSAWGRWEQCMEETKTRCDLTHEHKT